MKTISKTALLIAGLLTIPGIYTQAAPTQPRNQVNRRLHRQNKRINQGVRNGSLTKQEAHHLRSEDRAVKKQEASMRKVNGGKLTSADKSALNQEENKVSRDIYQDKHN